MDGTDTLVIFDFDRTLIAKDSFILFSLLASKSPLQLAIATAAAMLCKIGAIDNTKYKKIILERLWCGKGKVAKAQIIDALRSRMLSEMRESVWNRLYEHIDARHEVVIMSASPEFYLKPFALSMTTGIEVYGTKIFFNKATVSIQNLFGAAKAETAEILVNKHPISRILLYTDSLSDLALMYLATEIILVSPSRRCISKLKELGVSFQVFGQ